MKSRKTLIMKKKLEIWWRECAKCWSEKNLQKVSKTTPKQGPRSIKINVKIHKQTNTNFGQICIGELRQFFKLDLCNSKQLSIMRAGLATAKGYSGKLCQDYNGMKRNIFIMKSPPLPDVLFTWGWDCNFKLDLCNSK